MMKEKGKPKASVAAAAVVLAFTLIIVVTIGYVSHYCSSVY